MLQDPHLHLIQIFFCSSNSIFSCVNETKLFIIFFDVETIIYLELTYKLPWALLKLWSTEINDAKIIDIIQKLIN